MNASAVKPDDPLAGNEAVKCAIAGHVPPITKTNDMAPLHVFLSWLAQDF
jgi:hypothetical protein